MKGRIFLVLVLVAAAWVAGRQLGIGARGEGRYEFNQSFQLAPGAQVEVKGINGPVEVATSDGTTAEVHVLVTARDEDALDAHRINVEQTGAGLSIRGENRGGWSLWHWLKGEGPVRQTVTLKLPRQTEFSAKGVNGRVTVGELAGAVHVAGVNGKVEIAQAAGAADVSGVNGAVSLGLADLSGDGLRVSGVNGRVELRFADEVNADVTVRGLNGNVSNDLPNTTLTQEGRGTWRGRVGDGGTQINISGVNGSVRLARE
ncbi:MAG TPA: hypothetical protein VF546_18110 [Pyrinomonadaceae bacterium]|jgi:hypothetical protein